MTKRKELTILALAECRKILEKGDQIEQGIVGEDDYTNWYVYKPELNITMSAYYLREDTILDQWIVAEPDLKKATNIDQAWENIKSSLEMVIDDYIYTRMTEEEIDSCMKHPEELLSSLKIHGEE